MTPAGEVSVAAEELRAAEASAEGLSATEARAAQARAAEGLSATEARAAQARAAWAAARAGEVAEKLARVRGWLDEAGYGAALFTSQPSVAWVTAGLEDRVCRNEEPGLVWALVTGTGAFLITTNIELPRLAAEEDCTEFELHAVPWYSPGGLAEAADRLGGGSPGRRPEAGRGPRRAADAAGRRGAGPARGPRRGLRQGPGGGPARLAAP